MLMFSHYMKTILSNYDAVTASFTSRWQQTINITHVSGLTELVQEIQSHVHEFVPGSLSDTKTVQLSVFILNQ